VQHGLSLVVMVMQAVLAVVVQWEQLQVIRQAVELQLRATQVVLQVMEMLAVEVIAAQGFFLVAAVEVRAQQL
jgi:hypothetical protein